MRRDAIRRRAGGAIVSEMTLEPCPFCGTTDIEVYPTDRERARWNVCCGNPGCVTRGDNDYLTESDAVSAWNRRAHIAQHAELVAKLRELATGISTSTYAANSRLMAHTMLAHLDAQPVLTSKSTVINNESRESP
jgi:Lar family restriction alleviation protein